MSTVVEPKPEFRSLSEESVLVALADTDPENAIAAEVARLIAGYTQNFSEHIERLGYLPSQVLRIKARWPIEAVAMRLTTQTIRDTVSNPKASVAS